MLSLSNRNLFVCSGRVDMRKSFNGLCAIVEESLNLSPRKRGDAFVFIGKSRNRMKVLFYDVDGFWCCAKRLDAKTFIFPEIDGKGDDLLFIALDEFEWQNILSSPSR